MCNLAKLRVARDPLPFPPPLDRLWLNVNKVIDVFHFQNHVSAECREKFSPAKLKQQHPDYNTQAGEQTFVWIHRFKHILCSMNKVHHLFYLHRMVLRRNEIHEPLLSKRKETYSSEGHFKEQRMTVVYLHMEYISGLIVLLCSLH